MASKYTPIHVDAFDYKISAVTSKYTAIHEDASDFGISTVASNYNDDSLENYTPFNVPPNADRLKEVARKQLGETEEIKEESLKELRMLIKENNVKCVTRDDFLLRFLRVRKFDVQLSFETVRNYAGQRVTLDKYLQNLQPETLKIILQNNIFSIFPYRDVQERLIFFNKTGIWTPDMCSAEDVVMTMLLVSNYLSEKPSVQITGLVCVFDYETMFLEDVPYFIGHIKFSTNFLLNGVPARYPAMHILNESFLHRTVARIVDPFISQKIKDRRTFHGESRDVFFQHLPPTIVPNELGGSLGPMNNDHLIDEMVDYLEKMKDEQRYFIE